MTDWVFNLTSIFRILSVKPSHPPGAFGRRESAPADVVDKWRNNYIFTGDGAAYTEGKKFPNIIFAFVYTKALIISSNI